VKALDSTHQQLNLNTITEGITSMAESISCVGSAICDSLINITPNSANSKYNYFDSNIIKKHNSFADIVKNNANSINNLNRNSCNLKFINNSSCSSPEINSLNNNHSIYNLDKNKCVVIKQVNDKKTFTFDYVRANLSLKLSGLKVIHSKLSMNNNLYVYCYDEKSFNMLCNSELLFFNSASKPISLNLFTTENTSYKIFLPNVNKLISINTISDELVTYIKNNTSTDFAKLNLFMQIIRLKKNNSDLNSVLIILKDEFIYNYLLKNGLGICNIFYTCTKFVQKLHVKHCINCLKYGHVANNCKSTKIICPNCLDCHENKVCINPTITCINCKVNTHKSGSQDCPTYINKLNQLSNNNDSTQ
jgi:hypothetical protein